MDFKKWSLVGVAVLALGALAFANMQEAPRDAKVVDLGDGYVRVESSLYTVEVPKGWAVGAETPWGARSMAPEGTKGELGVMTAGPTTASWDELYQTSLYFIMREERGKATPYELSRTRQGYEAMSFSVLDSEGFPARRYVLLKAPSGRALALSVKIPSQASEKQWQVHFERMVRTARLKNPS